MSASTYLDAWLSGPDDTRLYTQTYTPPTPPVAMLVFVHGAAEHCGRYTHTHTSLSAEHGVAVFTYDQRGFGKTALDVQNRTPGAAYGFQGGEMKYSQLKAANIAAGFHCYC